MFLCMTVDLVSMSVFLYISVIVLVYGIVGCLETFADQN